jgi:tRNA pseudouridine55 synthase
MNKIFVVNKPIFISSNHYLNRIKRKYRVKKAGFSGTLDPFAKGCLIVAFGQYTKLFRYLKKTPKTYRATLWLGAESDSLDIENITSIDDEKTLNEDEIKDKIKALEGEHTYLPPKYSAKKVEGKRAYDLARDNQTFELKQIRSSVYESKFINYCHPFMTLELTVSEGSYIRSLAQILAERLQVTATLSFLERLHEGNFYFNQENPITDIHNYLDLEVNSYSGDKEWFELGKKLDINYFEKQQEGEYLVVFDKFFSVIAIKESCVSYILNRIYFEN